MNAKLKRGFGVGGVLWNLVGVSTYLTYVGLLGAEGAGPPPGGKALPAVIHACYAIGVFGGVIGSIGLALLRPWAATLLWIAFVAIAIDWGWVFSYSGQPSVPLGIAVVTIALMLALVSGRPSRMSQQSSTKNA